MSHIELGREALDDNNSISISDAVVRIVSSFAARDNATVEEVLALAQQLPGALGSAVQITARASQITPSVHIGIAHPAVPVDQSVTDEAVTCLCCGRSFTMLKRHLKAEHGLSESQYRAQFGLDEDHPLVAPNYSIRKAEYAKRNGLGKHARDDSAAQGASPTA